MIKAQSPEGPVSIENIHEFIAFLSALKTMHKQTEEALKGYLTEISDGKKEGHVVFRDADQQPAGSYGYYDKPSRKFDSSKDEAEEKKRFLKAIYDGEGSEADVMKLITIAPSKAEKISKKLGVTFEDFFIDDIVVTFGAFDPKKYKATGGLSAIVSEVQAQE